MNENSRINKPNEENQFNANKIKYHCINYDPKLLDNINIPSNMGMDIDFNNQEGTNTNSGIKKMEIDSNKQEINSVLNSGNNGMYIDFNEQESNSVLNPKNDFPEEYPLSDSYFYKNKLNDNYNIFDINTNNNYFDFENIEEYESNLNSESQLFPNHDFVNGFI